MKYDNAGEKLYSQTYSNVLRGIDSKAYYDILSIVAGGIYYNLTHAVSLPIGEIIFPNIEEDPLFEYLYEYEEPYPFESDKEGE